MTTIEFDNIYMKKFNKSDFAKIYKSASGILFKKTTEKEDNNAEYKYEPYLKLLFDTYNNEEEMKFIKQANDYLDLSPVYVWVKLNEQKINEYYNKEDVAYENKLEHSNQSQLRISIGAFWGWVMRSDTTNNTSIRWLKQYSKETKKHNINSKHAFGFKTAAIFKCQ